MSTVGAPAPLPVIVRGSPTRNSDFKEAYQEGLVRAIAAASGVVVSKPDIDEGIDLTLTHRHSSHMGDGVARLEVQLKATETAPTQTGYSVQIARERFEMLSFADPAVSKILIIMSVPSSQDDWVHLNKTRARIRNTAYWVNIDGASSSAAMPSVVAPFTQRFDDQALCDMMMRIGMGGKP